MKRYARTAIKVFLWLIVIIIALIILVLLALQTSPIQNLAKNKAVHFLQDKLKTPVAIGRLSVDFPKTVVLEGVYFGDRLGDTLLAGDTMKVDINMWKLLDRQVVIQEIDLRGITSHVTRTLSDSTYSFDYILKAFTSPKGTAQDTTAPMRFSLDKINLDRIHIKYADEVTGNDVSMLLRHFDTRITNFDLQHQKYSIPKITLDGLDVVMRQTKALSKKAVTTDTFNIPPPFTYPDVKFQEFDVSNVNIDFKNTVTAIDSKLGLGHLLIEMNDLNLPNQQIDIRLVHLDNTTGQFALGKTAQKAVIATSTEVVTTLQKGWNINLDKLEMDSINLKYNSLAAKKQTRGIDYNNLDLKDLVVDASHIVYAPDTIYGKVNQLTVKEGSGLEVKEFNGDIYYGKNTITLDHFVIETPRSHLSDQITLSYPSLDTLSKDAGALGLRGHFDENRLAVSDLLLFAPKLAYIDPFRKNQNSIMYISGNIDGQIKDLAISDLNISGIGSIQLHASGRIVGLPDISKAYFDLHIDQFASNANDLNDLIPTGTIPSNIRIPDYIRANGNFKGTFKNFSTNLHTTSEYGLADINATLKNMSIKGKESYDATIKTSQFNIGRMMRREDKLGMITMAGSIKGHGMNPKTLNAILQGNIASLTYNGYTYQNLTLSGNAANGTMEGQAKMLDPNIAFDLDAKADMNGTYPKLNFTLNADTINLQKLHFYQKELRLHGKIVANLTTADPDFLNGSIEITNAIIANETKKYKLDTISIVSVATEGEDSLNLTSEFLNVQLNGQYNLTDIYPALTGTIDKYIETNPGKDTVVTFKPQRIAFSARVIRSPLIEQILPDLTEMEDANLAGNFNSETGEIKIAGSVPRMRYKDYTVDNLKLDIETKIDALNYAITFDQLGSQKYQVRNTSLSGKAQNNILDVSLQVRDADDKEQYRIAGELRAISRLFEFKMLPDGLMLNYKSWNVAPDNAIQHGNEGWMVRNFKVSNGGQSMVINSSPQQLNAPMELEFNDFRIETFTRLISKDSLLAGGIINGHANVRNLNTNMVFTSDLTIGDFVFHGDTVGDVALKVNNETPNTYSANVTITGYGNEVKMLGSYYDDGTKSLYDLDVDIVKMNMKSVQAFTGGELKNSSGSVDGKLHIKGTLDAPDVRGDLHFQEAGFTVSRFNAHYKVTDETLSFTPEGLRFNQFTLVDTTGNLAILDGMVFTKDYKDYRFDLNFRAQDFQVMNSTRENNKLYYGQLYMDAHMHIGGAINNPVVDGSVRVNDKTNLTIVIPQRDPGLVDREGIVEFVDMDTIHTMMTASLPDSIIKSELVGLDVAVNITIDKKAELNLIIDEANGDYLNVKGEGNLTGGIDPSGKIALTGIYELEEGSYRFSFNQVKREFQIQKGSYISWMGDPYTADVNVTAIYTANVAPLSLVQNQLAEAQQSVINTYKQKLPFQILLNMRGQLMKPEVNFDIDLPTKNYGVSSEVVSTVQTRLTQLRTEPSELNKQVFAVLLLNRFISEDPFQNSARGGGISSLARQSASKLLSEQLNNLIGGKIAGFDVTFDINSIEDYTSGELKNRTDLSVGLSKQLLDDRLKISVGSNFELEGPQETDRKTTNIAGDVSAEYQLSKDGRYLIRAYRKDEYIVVQGQVVETGLGFAFTTDYEKFKDIFAKKTEEYKLIKKVEHAIKKEEKKNGTE